VSAAVLQKLRQYLTGSGSGFLLLVCLAFPLQAEDEDLSLEAAKAHYVIEASKHIEWPGDSKMKAIRVAIVSGDHALDEAFRALEPIQIRGKVLEFDYLDRAEFEPEDYDLIFLGRRFRNLNEFLMDATTATLIIVDGRVEREQQMLSLLTVGNQLWLRLNRDRLVQRGFQPSINLLEFAGTKEDLTDQLRANELRLDKVLEEVNAKEARVEALNAELTANSESLERARSALKQKEDELEASRRRLQDLAQQIEAAQQDVQDYRIQIEEQEAQFVRTQQDIHDKQAEIFAKETAIQGLQEEIDKNQRVLDQQMTRLNQQRSMLVEQSATIDELRLRLGAILGVILVISVLVYFLLRLNTLRKRANLELEKLNAQLYELATTDSMTGLSNRRHFIELGQKELLRHQRDETALSVLMMDVDRFKRVNDSYGHAAGDKVIEVVGHLLSKNLREYDLVGRLGGEEYSMLLLDCDEQQSLEIARRICADVAAAEIEFESEIIRVTISIGVGKMLPGDQEIEQPLVRADKALFQAKEAGRNRVVLYRSNEDGVG
jgi:diguanylate cyclase (GGDEF)-like protein